MKCLHCGDPLGDSIVQIRTTEPWEQRGQRRPARRVMSFVGTFCSKMCAFRYLAPEADPVISAEIDKRDKRMSTLSENWDNLKRQWDLLERRWEELEQKRLAAKRVHKVEVLEPELQPLRRELDYAERKVREHADLVKRNKNSGLDVSQPEYHQEVLDKREKARARRDELIAQIDAIKRDRAFVPDLALSAQLETLRADLTRTAETANIIAEELGRPLFKVPEPDADFDPDVLLPAAWGIPGEGARV